MPTSVLTSFLAFTLLLSLSACTRSAATPTTAPETRNVVPNDTLDGKVVAGYQGWFNAPGDGSGFQWRHQGPRPGQITIDMWPDVSELDEDEKFATEFKHADGSTAYLFSSHKQKTVLRHFKWMRDYDLDGVFVQRFVSETKSPRIKNHVDTVMASAKKGAHEYGRVYGLMYDLSGVKDTPEEIDHIINDFKGLVDRFGFAADDRYIRHRGKPVVALWGLGFEGKRDPLTTGGLRLIRFLQNDAKYGGNVVMVGVPNQWRSLKESPTFSKSDFDTLIDAADIVQPWWVGRNRTPEDVRRNAEAIWKPELQWCAQRGKDYMPVIYPGFTWYNLQRRNSPSNMIPRRGGQFLWEQFKAAKAAGAKMVYVAMFDEMDEGTAIFKLTNDVPDGEGVSQFVPLEGLPSDFYLRLVGQGGRLFRGQMKDTDDSLVRDAKWTPFTPKLPVVPSTYSTEKPNRPN